MNEEASGSRKGSGGTGERFGVYRCLFKNMEPEKGRFLFYKHELYKETIPGHTFHRAGRRKPDPEKDQEEIYMKQERNLYENLHRKQGIHSNTKQAARFGRRAGILALLLLTVFLGLERYGKEQLARELSEKIIRFHVRANSDSEKDQELKLAVRDEIGAYMQEELAGIRDLAQSRRKVLQDLEEIERRARQVIAEKGCGYEVSASLAKVDFPEKTYGTYTFPAGEYEALQVVIGQGKGKNWWCVMYPNMCFQGSVYEVIEEEAEASLKQVLTAREYDALMKSGNYRIKWKWLSFLDPLFESF